MCTESRRSRAVWLPSPPAFRCHPGAPSPFTGRRFRAIFCCGGCADAQPSPPREGSGPVVKDTSVSYGGGGGGVCTWTGTPETNRTRRVKSHLPNREPRAARSQAPQPWQPCPPCSVSRAPEPALDWQPVAERQRQRDLQEGRVEKRRGRSHTRFVPPQISTMSQKKGGSLGGLGGTAREHTGPPSFSSQPRSLAGTNRHLLSFDGLPAHQGSLCWTASGLLVDKVRPKPRWSGSLLAVCPVSCWSGVKTARRVEHGKNVCEPKMGHGAAWDEGRDRPRMARLPLQGRSGLGNLKKEGKKLLMGDRWPCCRFQMSISSRSTSP